MKEFISDTLLSTKAKDRGIFNIDILKQQISDQSKFSRELWGVLSLELFFNNFFDE